MEGLWFAHFNAGPEYGDGMVVLRHGEILGGDRGHIYTGTYHSDGPYLYARVHVNPYVWTLALANQPLNETLNLTLRGQLSGNSAIVSGHPDNQNDVNVFVELRRAA
jgi:T3SS negative regulator,GrlR